MTDVVAKLEKKCETDNDPCLREAIAEIKRLRDLADCPLGVSPESRELCSAGYCVYCLVDRIKFLSDQDEKRTSLVEELAKKVGDLMDEATKKVAQ